MRVSRNALLMRAGLIIIILIGVGLFAIRKSFYSDFGYQQFTAILVVQPVILIGLILQGVRHAMLVDRPGLSYLVATKAVALAQGLNLLLPVRLSEVLKATYLRDHANVPMSVGLSAVLLERTVDIIIFSFLGLLCLFFFSALVSKNLILMLVVMVTVILGAGKWGGGGVAGLVRILPWPRIVGLIERAYLHFSESLKRPRFLLSLGLGLLIWGLSFFNILLVIRYSNIFEIGLYGALLVFVCTTFGGAVPALPGGLGAYEASAVFALMSLGCGFSDALILAITIHVAQMIPSLILALIIMLTDRLGLSSLISDLRNKMVEQHE